MDNSNLLLAGVLVFIGLLVWRRRHDLGQQLVSVDVGAVVLILGGLLVIALLNSVSG